MPVEAIILLRADGDGTEDNSYAPRSADLAPYGSLAWEDVTGRAGIPAEQEASPRLVVIQARMSNADAAAMLSDAKLWVVGAVRYDNEGNAVEDNWSTPYTSQERTTRINQLVNDGANRTTVERHWTSGMTRRQLAPRLREYLRTRA